MPVEAWALLARDGPQLTMRWFGPLLARFYHRTSNENHELLGIPNLAGGYDLLQKDQRKSSVEVRWWRNSSTALRRWPVPSRGFQREAPRGAINYHGNGYGDSDHNPNDTSRIVNEKEGGRSRSGERRGSGSKITNPPLPSTEDQDASLPDTPFQRPIGIDFRRRDPRVNGSDLYVVRVKKTGMGNAMPCWRCLEWCRWAGVKRVFHWSKDEHKWMMVKVNDTDSKLYQTRSDEEKGKGLP
ncbi:hypothetical protein FRC02_002271 [Tulasnella sp. 418]|nr:hypothetical protein FRC02_002271 [Tulasnella sp. 418]